MTLTKEDINTEDMTLVLRDAKRKNLRTIPIHRDLYSIMCSWNWTWPSDPTKAFTRDARRANLNDVDLHCLRVTFITRLIKAGNDLQTVQRLAGHANIMTTLKYYLRTVHPDVRSALERLTI